MLNCSSLYNEIVLQPPKRAYIRRSKSRPSLSETPNPEAGPSTVVTNPSVSPLNKVENKGDLQKKSTLVS